MEMNGQNIKIRVPVSNEMTFFKLSDIKNINLELNVLTSMVN